METKLHETTELSSNFIKSIIRNSVDNAIISDGHNIFNDKHRLNIYIKPLKKIDNIHVSLMICINNSGEVYAEIHRSGNIKYTLLIFDNIVNTNKFYEDCNKACNIDCTEYDCNCNEYIINIDELNELVDSIDWYYYMNYIIKLKYNSILDTFVAYDINDNDLKLLGNEFSECCICYSNTTYKDTNDHYLCSICFEKLKNINCPLCRQTLTIENYNYVKLKKNEVYL